MTILTNGKVVTPDRELGGHSVIIEDGIIEVVCEDHELRGYTGLFLPDRTVIDVEGAYIMPGIVDIHSDYIEYVAAPRPNSIMNFSFALREAERQLITCGITTMFHSVSFYTFTEFSRSPVRRPENTRRVVHAIRSSHLAEHIINHRFHARVEIDSLNRVQEIESYLDEQSVDLLSFMDHTPGQGQYRNLEMYRQTLKGYRNLSEQEIDRTIAVSQGREKMTADLIGRLSSHAIEQGIAVASHDDDSTSKVDLIRSLGASISEFPVALEIALHARSVGMHTVAGAPNVLLGRSHSGNLSATEAVRSQAVDVLCSDYYPAAMLHAAFRLSEELRVPLCETVRLITLNAARAARIDSQTGSLEPGKSADVIVVRMLSDGSPAVRRAFVHGIPVYSGEHRGRPR